MCISHSDVNVWVANPLDMLKSITRGCIKENEQAPLPSICTIFSRENQKQASPCTLNLLQKGNTNLKRFILQTIGIEVLPLVYCMYNSTLKETYLKMSCP